MVYNITMKKILIFLIVAVVIGGIYFIFADSNVPANSSLDSNSQNEISTAGGVYTSEEYGFRFSYPDDWYMGNGDLERGTLQFFNYDKSKASGAVFSAGTNKIEAIVVAVSPYEPSSDYPEKTHMTTKTVVGGREASRIEVELVGGEKMLGYLIPLANTNGKFLAIAIYGDPLNFRILEDIVTGFGWME